MAEVGQAEPLRSGLASEVVLGWEGRVQQGVQRGVVEVVVCGKVKLVIEQGRRRIQNYSLLCLDALASLGTDDCLSGVLD